MGDFKYEELDKPKINSEEVLVKMKYCGLCGTDIHKILHKTVNTPIVLGHEAVGEVVEAGVNVENFKTGDRVFFAHHVPCFTCHYCLRGKYSLCKQFSATNIDPGGFSEYIRVPKENVKNTMHRIPEDISYQQASMIEPLACCLYGLNKIDVRNSDNVLIMGAGQIGALYIQLMRSLGVNSIVVSDISEFRLNKALELGADVSIDAGQKEVTEEVLNLTKGKGVRTVIICSSVSSLLSDAINCIQRGGQVLVFAPFDEKLTTKIDASRFFKDEISVVGSYSSSPYDYDIAMNMIKQKRFSIEKMITHTFTLEELQEAVDTAVNPMSHALKILITTSKVI